MAAKDRPSLDPVRQAEFERAFEQLGSLVDLKQADLLHPVRGNAVYTSSVVLWMPAYQRMSPDTSLEAAVKKLIHSQPTLFAGQ